MKARLSAVKAIERRISRINHASVNGKVALKIVIEMAVIGILYLSYCFYFFHGIWYLDFLIAASTFTFLFCYLDMRLEGMENQFKRDIPKTVRKFRYYLLNTKDISKALEKTCARAPDTTRKYFQELKEAVDSSDLQGEIEKLKENTAFEWLKMLCDLVYYYKVNGDKECVVTRNMGRMTKIIEFVNIQQSLDNVQLIFAQKFVVFLPLLGIPGVQLFYRFLLNVLDQPDLYLMQTAGIMAAQILLLSNLANIFISWIRKNN